MKVFFSQHGTSIILALSYILFLSMFWFLPQVAFVIFFALLINLLLQSFVTKMPRFKKLPRSFAAVVSLFAFVVFMIILLTILGSTMTIALQKFSEDLPVLNENLRQLFSSSHFLSEKIDELWKEIATMSVAALQSSLSLIISIFTKVFDFVMVLFIAFYLLSDGHYIQRWVSRLFPKKDHRRVHKLFSKILQSLQIYIFSQLMVCALMGIIVFIYFSTLELPYAVVFAVVSGVSEFVPVIGPTIASALGIAVTATISPWLAGQTAFFYFFITQVNHNILYPIFIGRSLHLHPISIVVGILIGGCLLNAPGMFLAVPVMVVTRLLIIDIYQSIKTINTIDKES